MKRPGALEVHTTRTCPELKRDFRGKTVMMTLERLIFAHVLPLASHYYSHFTDEETVQRNWDFSESGKPQACDLSFSFFKFKMGTWKLWKEGKKDEPKRCETKKGESLRNSELSNLSRKIKQGKKSEMIRFFSFIPIQVNNMHSPSFYSSPVCTYFSTHHFYSYIIHFLAHWVNTLSLYPVSFCNSFLYSLPVKVYP